MSRNAATKTPPVPARMPEPAGRALVPAQVSCAADEALRRDAKQRFQDLDRQVHAQLGSAVGGLSVIGLAQAWGDWAAHLALSPGKRMALGLEAWQKWI